MLVLVGCPTFARHSVLHSKIDIALHPALTEGFGKYTNNVV